MINLEQKDMCEAELRQAIRILQSVLINLRKSNELEMEIHYSDKLFVKNILNEKLMPLLQIHGFKVGNKCAHSNGMRWCT